MSSLKQASPEVRAEVDSVIRAYRSLQTGVSVADDVLVAVAKSGMLLGMQVAMGNPPSPLLFRTHAAILVGAALDFQKLADKAADLAAIFNDGLELLGEEKVEGDLISQGGIKALLRPVFAGDEQAEARIESFGG